MQQPKGVKLINLFWELESIWAYIFHFYWIYTMSFTLSFGLLTAKVPNGMHLTRQCWGQQHFWSSELAAQTRYHSFYKGNEGNSVWDLGKRLKGNRAHEIWDLGYHALGVCHPKQNTITYFNRATVSTYENHTEIHRIMNGSKECIWKQRDPSTHLLATECLNHTQNKLKLFTMFPNVFFIFPSTFNY